jgi:hypothetical protein
VIDTTAPELSAKATEKRPGVKRLIGACASTAIPARDFDLEIHPRALFAESVVMRWELLCVYLPATALGEGGRVLAVQAAYFERNRANELLLAKNYVNKMISAREFG